MVPSMITYSKSGSPDKRWKIVSNTPLLAHRRNLRKTEFQFPKHSGRSRQGAPTRTIQRTASKKSRVSAAERPGSPAFPGRSGAIRAHCSSRNTLRSKATSRLAALKQIASGLGTPINPECQQALALVTVVDSIDALSRRIKVLETRIRHWHRANLASQSLATIPGIGPITATAIAATVPDPKAFRSGRHFAAWLG